MSATERSKDLQLSQFESSIKEWSDMVQAEIGRREQIHSSDLVNKYNQDVCYGLKLAYAMMQDAMRRQITKAMEAVDAEEEFEGEIPQAIFDAASASPEAMAEAMRIACRLTKQGIKKRIEEGLL